MCAGVGVGATTHINSDVGVGAGFTTMCDSGNMCMNARERERERETPDGGQLNVYNLYGNVVMHIDRLIHTSTY